MKPKEEEFWGRIEGPNCKGRRQENYRFRYLVDIGGKDGLVHNSEISWGGRPDFSLICQKVGDIIDVKIMDANRKGQGFAQY